jgi:hypothetical protein
MSVSADVLTDLASDLSDAGCRVMLSFGGKPDTTRLSVMSAPSVRTLLALAAAYDLDVSYNAGSGFHFFDCPPAAEPDTRTCIPDEATTIGERAECPGYAGNE